MPASSKKSPLTTTKKKKVTPVSGKNKRNGVAKKDKGKDLVNNKDGSYLNERKERKSFYVGFHGRSATYRSINFVFSRSHSIERFGPTRAVKFGSHEAVGKTGTK